MKANRSVRLEGVGQLDGLKAGRLEKLEVRSICEERPIR